MNGSRCATARSFIVSALCSTNGNCICAFTEQLADHFHAFEQDVVDDLQRGLDVFARHTRPLRGAWSRSRFSPSMMCFLRASSIVSPSQGYFSLDAWTVAADAARVGEQADKMRERVERLAAVHAGHGVCRKSDRSRHSTAHRGCDFSGGFSTGVDDGARQAGVAQARGGTREFSTTRAAGLRPKLTRSLRPTTVWHSGRCLLIRRVPSMVSSALRPVFFDAGADGQHERVEKQVAIFQTVLDPTARSRMRVRDRRACALSCAPSR